MKKKWIWSKTTKRHVILLDIKNEIRTSIILFSYCDWLTDHFKSRPFLSYPQTRKLKENSKILFFSSYLTLINLEPKYIFFFSCNTSREQWIYRTKRGGRRRRERRETIQMAGVIPVGSERETSADFSRKFSKQFGIVETVQLYNGYKHPCTLRWVKEALAGCSLLLVLGWVFLFVY